MTRPQTPRNDDKVPGETVVVVWIVIAVCVAAVLGICAMVRFLT